ncbi:MAG: ABC transporter permease [Bacteroidales bacterium]|nr:ABC transporter permease [Bacteroidales bacterium]
MKESLEPIQLERLAIILLPVALVVFIHIRWKTKPLNSIYAIARMLLQLTLIGYILTYIFELHKAWIIIVVLAVMTSAASIIAIRTVSNKMPKIYLYAFISLVTGGGIVLFISTQLVLQLEPWFFPRYFVPLAGMTFANAMTSISLAAERFESELKTGKSFSQIRAQAYKAALIPVTNSLFAVGLVSIPGMMTGQILSGISPLIAARYQVMIMCMVYASAGLTTAIFLTLFKKESINSIKGS